MSVTRLLAELGQSGAVMREGQRESVGSILLYSPLQVEL
jgi:hypothetical protein